MRFHFLSSLRPLLAVVLPIVLIGCGGSVTQDSSAPATWELTLGGDTFQQANAVIRANDGGYILAGMIGLGDDADVHLVKIDTNGEMIWERTIGGAAIDEARSIVPDDDGGYVIAGLTESIGYGQADAYLLKVDATGQKLWERAYGGAADDDAVFAMPLSSATGYLLAGTVPGQAENTSLVVIIKTGETGSLLDRGIYGGDTYSQAFTGTQATDGGAIVVGTLPGDGQAHPSVYLLRFDASGALLWETTFGGDRAVHPRGITTVQSGYVIAGDVVPDGETRTDAYIAKIDESGNLLWERSFGSTKDEQIHAISQTTDGGCILAGWTQEIIIRGSDVYLVKTDADGNVEWERTYGSESIDEAYGVTTTPEGGYLVVGRTTGGMTYLIKTDSNGEIETES